jgi:RimJ/RimL family protein N-acetyltransferase
VATRPALDLPDGFDPPDRLEHERFRLRMLSIRDVDADLEAILDRVTPEGEPDPPQGLTRERNLADLGWHETEFRIRSSFAYTVVEPDDSRVIGCVYIYPDDDADAQVRLWVRRDAAALDSVLEDAVREWIELAWPFTRVRWPGREKG